LSFPNASMADITQGGIWGDFSNIEDFKPSQLALDLKTLIKDKNVVVTLNGVSMPSTTNDGIGFPENFGAWWNENYIGVLDYNNSPASLYFNFSDNVEVSIKGYGYLYDDASCITNPQSTKTYTAGLNYIYFKTDSISTIRISNKSKVIGLGSEDICFNNNSNYKLKIDLNFFGNVTKINLQGNVDLIGTLPSNLTYLYLDNIYWESKEALPESLTYFHLYGDNIHWTYTGVLYPNPVNIHFNNVYWTYKKELPSNLTHLHLEGNNIYFIYEGELPNNLVYLHLFGNNTGWIYEGSLPENLTYLHLYSNGIKWTYNGALPINLTYLKLMSYNIYWTYVGELPTNLTTLCLNGNNINWTYVGALPSALTYCNLWYDGIHWTYEGAMPNGLTYLRLEGFNINWTYEGAMPNGLTYLRLCGDNIHWTYEGAIPNGLTYLYLGGFNINWTYEGAMPNGLTYLHLSGDNIHWTYTSWNFANNFRYYAIYVIYVIGSLHTRENIISVLNKGAQVTWTNEKQISLYAHASMADTEQGGIWGDFSDIDNFQPSQLALDLKTLVKDKGVTVSLKDIVIPGELDDDEGFPVNFGAWWRS